MSNELDDNHSEVKLRLIANDEEANRRRNLYQPVMGGNFQSLGQVNVAMTSEESHSPMHGSFDPNSGQNAALSSTSPGGVSLPMNMWLGGNSEKVKNLSA